MLTPKSSAFEMPQCKESGVLVSSSISALGLCGRLTGCNRSPIGLGRWLSSQCRELGVNIRTGLRIKAVELSDGNTVQAVTCSKIDEGSSEQSPLRIECGRVLLACGPWTPKVFGTLFPSSPIRLRWVTNAGDWILCKNPCMKTQSTVGFVSFAPLLGEKIEFAARNDGTVWACGRRNIDADLPSPDLLGEPDEKLINELIDHARGWLNWNCTCDLAAETHHTAREFQLVGQGRAFRPATESGLPTISGVSASGLTDANGTADPASNPSGVFVCWGHGSYGLTLGMGSGRLISQLMLGEETDIDVSLFSLDESQGQPPESKL